MSTYQELKRQIADLEAKAEEARKQELQSIISGIKSKIAEYGLSAKDLGLSADGSSRRQGSTVAPKYMGPNGEKWTGRGRQPDWIKNAIENGRNKEDFLIK